MMTHTFVLARNRPIDDPTSDLLFEAGLGDAAVTAGVGEPALDVDRDAATLQEATGSAVRQAESVPGIREMRIERGSPGSPGLTSPSALSHLPSGGIWGRLEGEVQLGPKSGW